MLHVNGQLLRMLRPRSAEGKCIMLGLAIIFALAVFLVLITFLLYRSGGRADTGRETKEKEAEGKAIPRWNKPPSDSEQGDLGELASHGSLHQYLLHLHARGRCPVTSFWWGRNHMVSVCSPQAFKDTVKLTNRPGELYKGFEPVFGASSITYANGSDWEERRKCLYHTLKGDDLESYFPHFVRIAQEKEAKWSGFTSEQKVPLCKETFHMAIKGITRCCLGDVFESNEEVDALAENYHTCWREMEMRVIESKGDPEPGSERDVAFQRGLQGMRDTVKRILRSRREGRGQTEIPFIDALLQSGVPDKQIVDEAITFLVAGLHTSGYFLAWLLWFLAKHPEVQERVREEGEGQVGGECGDRLKAYASDTETYLRQVLDETLRFSTLAPYAARFSESDTKVAGHCVPAHTFIIHALGVALKSEESWDNAESFDPNRFSPGSPHARKAGSRGLEFCPFGVPSRRKCPGYLFSYFEVSVFATILLHRFTIVPVEGQTVEQVHGLVTEPKEEIYVHIRPRE